MHGVTGPPVSAETHLVPRADEARRVALDGGAGRRKRERLSEILLDVDVRVVRRVGRQCGSIVRGRLTCMSAASATGRAGKNQQARGESRENTRYSHWPSSH